MEEKICDRQVTKQSLSLRVVDEMQIERHYTASDLAELVTYSPAPPPSPPYERPEVNNLKSLFWCPLLVKIDHCLDPGVTYAVECHRRTV